MSISGSTATYLDRLDRARRRMHEAGVDVLLVSVGRDLPYLTGYEAMPLERLTMLVVPRDGDATLVVPRLEAPRVVEQPGVFTVLPWNETDDPIAVVAGLVGRPATAAIGDTMWARFLVDLLGHWPSSSTRYVRSTEVMNALRMRKDAAEIAALAAAGRRRRPDRRRAAGRPASRWSAAPRPRSAPTSGRGSSPRVTNGSTSPSSRPARTRHRRTTTPANG